MESKIKSTNPVPQEMTPTDWINLTGFQKYVVRQLEVIEERLKRLEGGNNGRRRNNR